MTDYQRGFLEGLQAAVLAAGAARKQHFANADDPDLDAEDQDHALNCAMVLGQLVSSLKTLAAQVHRGQLDPTKIAEANGRPYWWATPDGKGRS